MMVAMLNPICFMRELAKDMRHGFSYVFCACGALTKGTARNPHMCLECEAFYEAMFGDHNIEVCCFDCVEASCTCPECDGHDLDCAGCKCKGQL
jgi:hypothetical protein